MTQQQQPDKTADELRIELRDVRRAVGEILDDYERTAETLDAVTTQIDGIETTDHAGNVQQLKSELLESLQDDADTISPPWVREGYDSKEAWLDAEGQ